MAGRFVGFGKKLFDLAKKPGEKSSTVATIIGVAPKINKSKITKAVDDVKLTSLKAKGKMKKQSQDFDGSIRKVQTKLGQTMQKLKNEPVTESGVSKGKNLKKVEKKADGGRIGRRFGGDTMKKKTNVEKIKETFSSNKKLKPVDPKKQKGLAKLPRKVRNNMGYMKSGGRAGFKGGGADMTNVASDKTKKEAKKFEKRAKAASKDVKNIGRSFTSIMNEKYRP